MGDSAMAVVAIFLAAILMFVFPLMTMADKKDDVSTLSIQTATEDFTTTIRTTGKITQDNYDNFSKTLAATGNAYDIDISVQKLDENPSKKETSNYQTIGENVYYTMYKSQIMTALNTNNGIMTLNEGDIVNVSVKNTNVTIGQQLRNFMYKVTGNNSSSITASASGIVTTNGK